MKTEAERVRVLESILRRANPKIRVGIGDDAAVIAGEDEDLVWTIDAQVDGTHFSTAWLGWHDVGYRSIMAAASDVAAMGARPLAILSGLSLADAIDDDAFEAIARGQVEAADLIQTPIIGGNMTRGRETSATTTVLGTVKSAVTRSGAKPGDGLWLAGSVGLAAAGLVALRNGLSDRVPARCLDAWRRPNARIADGLVMGPLAHASIDVSDGLSRDAHHLAEASDVHVTFDLEALLGAAGSELLSAAHVLGIEARDLALDGGEDYALLAASDVAIPAFTRVGTVEAARPGSRLSLRTSRGVEVIEPRGFDHFSRVPRSSS